MEVNYSPKAGFMQKGDIILVAIILGTIILAAIILGTIIQAAIILVEV
jgi:hypothetical protein